MWELLTIMFYVASSPNIGTRIPIFFLTFYFERYCVVINSGLRNNNCCYISQKHSFVIGDGWFCGNFFHACFDSCIDAEERVTFIKQGSHKTSYLTSSPFCR